MSVFPLPGESIGLRQVGPATSLRLTAPASGRSNPYCPTGKRQVAGRKTNHWKVEELLKDFLPQTWDSSGRKRK